MLFRILADLVLAAHLGFVLFAIFGGLLALRWRRIAWLHLPAAAWGVVIEFTGWVCPLTPLENWLRRAAGNTPYSGDFIVHYITPVLYSTTLTRADQLLYGSVLTAINVAIYSLVYRSALRAHSGSPTGRCS
jgi:hypothetical protein